MMMLTFHHGVHWALLLEPAYLTFVAAITWYVARATITCGAISHSTMALYLTLLWLTFLQLPLLECEESGDGLLRLPLSGNPREHRWIVLHQVSRARGSQGAVWAAGTLLGM